MKIAITLTRTVAWGKNFQVQPQTTTEVTPILHGERIVSYNDPGHAAFLTAVRYRRELSLLPVLKYGT
jgi:hypothetical protein